MAHGQSIPVPGYIPQQPNAPAPSPSSPPLYSQLQSHQQHEQQQAYPTMQPMSVYTIQAVIPPILGRRPTHMICPSCRSDIVTTVEYKTSQKTHIIALFMCFFTGCCCLPYCFNACKTACHYCPNCNNFLGTHDDDLF